MVLDLLLIVGAPEPPLRPGAALCSPQPSGPSETLRAGVPVPAPVARRNVKEDVKNGCRIAPLPAPGAREGPRAASLQQAPLQALRRSRTRARRAGGAGAGAQGPLQPPRPSCSRKSKAPAS